MRETISLREILDSEGFQAPLAATLALGKAVSGET